MPLRVMPPLLMIRKKGKKPLKRGIKEAKLRVKSIDLNATLEERKLARERLNLRLKTKMRRTPGVLYQVPDTNQPLLFILLGHSTTRYLYI
jgi:hypothetical protein